MARDCKNNQKYCNNCKNHSHYTQDCRARNRPNNNDEVQVIDEIQSAAKVSGQTQGRKRKEQGRKVKNPSKQGKQVTRKGKVQIPREGETTR